MYSSNSIRPCSSRQMLHGHLKLRVIEARDLPDMEGRLSKLFNKKDVTDPFVDITLGSAKLAKTKMILNSLCPVWDETFRIELCHFGDTLKLEVKDQDHAYSEDIGAVEILTNDLKDGELKKGWFPILSKKRKQKGELHLSVQFISKYQTLNQGYQVDCYFPMHQNCLVTLYQDAHCSQTVKMPQFQSMPFPHTPPSCWKDVYNAFIEAKHLICITGWSVWHELQLLRGEDLSIDQRTLGEILVEKANQGVKVYIMIWTDPSSGALIGEAGVAGTNDEATYNYFKPTRVHCAKVPREVDFSGESYLSDIAQNTWTKTYSHHQKTIICDSAGQGNQRRLVAFVGGIDLTNGKNFDNQNTRAICSVAPI